MNSEMPMSRGPLNSKIPAGHNGTGLLNLSINASKVPQRMIIMRCLIGKMMIEIFVILFCKLYDWIEMSKS
jgi:hypothetical protein